MSVRVNLFVLVPSGTHLQLIYVIYASHHPLRINLLSTLQIQNDFHTDFRVNINIAKSSVPLYMHKFTGTTDFRGKKEHMPLIKAIFCLLCLLLRTIHTYSPTRACSRRTLVEIQTNFWEYFLLPFNIYPLTSSCRPERYMRLPCVNGERVRYDNCWCT